VTALASGVLPVMRFSDARTASGVGRANESGPISVWTSDSIHDSPICDWRSAASFLMFLYWTKPHSSAMPHASSTTPPNDSISFDRNDSDGAMLRTGTR